MVVGLERLQAEGDLHFVTFSCYHRCAYLESSAMRDLFVDGLQKAHLRYRFDVVGYVVMPEHVHLLVSEPKRYRLATTLNVLKAEVSKQVKGERKQFWQRRYYDFNVLSQAKQVEKLRYMHRNPVKRGLVDRPEDWAWSSFRHYLTGVEGRVEIESQWTWNRRERASSHP